MDASLFDIMTSLLASFMHSLYLCTAYIHIGSKEDIPVEYVIVEEENPQELPPEGEGHTSKPLPECLKHGPSTFRRGKPRTFHFLSISVLKISLE
jgi:hypothetical protein